MRILLIHGVGHKETSGTWDADWKLAIENAVGAVNPAVSLKFEKLPYDNFFADSEIDAAIVAEALARLLASGVWHGIGDLFTSRGFGDTIRWTAGMVAQWAADEKLRANCNKALEQQIHQFNPDVICAHSLGSLIAYDTLARHPEVVAGKTFVSLGSQPQKWHQRVTHAWFCDSGAFFRRGDPRNLREWIRYPGRCHRHGRRFAHRMVWSG